MVLLEDVGQAADQFHHPVGFSSQHAVEPGQVFEIGQRVPRILCPAGENLVGHHGEVGAGL